MAFNKNKVMEVARRYVEKGQLDKAIREYTRVVEEDPHDVRVWLKIGDLHVKNGAKREATETYLRVAPFYSEQGFFLKAVAVYKQILKLNPRLVEVNLKLAELYRQLGLMSDAMQHFEMVAGHFHREGKTSEALETVRQLVELAPDNVATRIKLAELYSKEGMTEEAVAEFTLACDHLRAQGREEDFVKVGERLLWHRSENVALSRELAGIYLRRNDARRALQKLQACFKANPRDVDTLELLAQAFQHLEQSAKTVSVLKEMARVLEEDGRRGDAIAVYERILQLAPGDRDALAQTGRSAEAAVAPPPSQGSHSTSMPPPGASASAPPPPPPAASAPPPPPPRGRALTVSVPVAGPRKPRPTGSVPLVGNQASFAQEAARSVGSGRPLVSDFADESSVAGEEHSESIAKIFTETDVYVKYGLHDKAIEHLRQVFALDPVNLEGHERLKEILLSQGRHAEAVVELVTLGDLCATYNRHRAAAYVREALVLAPEHAPAIELAQRIGLSAHGLSANPPASSPRPTSELVLDESADLSDFDIEVEEPQRRDGDTHIIVSPRNSVLRRGADPVDDPGDDPLIDESADSVDTAILSLDGLGIDDVDMLLGGGAEDPLAPQSFDNRADTAMGLATEVIELEQADSSDIFSSESMSDLLEEPFSTTLDGDGPATSVMNAFDLDDDLSLDLDEFEASSMVESALADPGEFVEQSTRPTTKAPDAGAGGIDDDLDEADFFVAQGLFDSAREILRNVLNTHPHHPLILAKLEELDELERGNATADSAPAAVAPETAVTDEPALLGPEESTIDRSLRAQRKPAVMLEKPVEDEDADTHYNLGLAYKEMGLYDEAIAEFEKTLTVPEREVQGRFMMGLCHRAQDDWLSAINQFKAGLHAPRINESEQLSLYYEIAMAYETGVNDLNEALYFYELIQKRDRDYRDLQDRISSCRGQPREEGSSSRESGDEVDAAVDSLLAETDHRSPRG